MPKQVFKFRCDSFELPAAFVNNIFFNPKLKDFTSNFHHLLCTAFAQTFNGVFNVSDHHQATKKGIVSIYLYCSCKKYRLIYNQSDVKEKVSLQFEVFSKTEDSCICHKNTPLARELRGEARDQEKKRLEKMSNKEYLDSKIDSAQLASIEKGNLQEIINPVIIRKMRHEILSSNDLEEDDIWDVQLRAKQDKIQNVASLQSFPEFSIILTKENWLKVLIDHSKSVTYLRLLLDATGNIIRKPYEQSSSILNHVLLVSIPKVNSKECILFPVAEMLTNDSSSYNIHRFLDFVNFRMRKILPQLRLADEIGTDFSFANINAIVKLNNNMTVKKFLDLCFEAFETGESTDALKELIIPQLCFSHISHNIMQDINKQYGKSEKYVVAAIIGGIITIENNQELDRYIKNAITILASPNCDTQFNSAKASLASHFDCATQQSSQKPPTDNLDNLDDQIVWREDKAIYKNSRFFQHFKSFFDKTISSSVIDEKLCDNKFYDLDFVNTFLKKYVAYLPLWTAFIGRLRCKNVPRANNARIERFFHGLKSDVRDKKLTMGSIGFIKVGRYIEFQEKRTDRLCKQIAIAAPQKSRNRKNKSGIEKNLAPSCTKKTSSSTEILSEINLASQKEEWKKKFRKSKRESAVFLNTSNLVQELSSTSKKINKT